MEHRDHHDRGSGDPRGPFVRLRAVVRACFMQLPIPGSEFAPRGRPYPVGGSDHSVGQPCQACPEWHSLPAHMTRSVSRYGLPGRHAHCGGRAAKARPWRLAACKDYRCHSAGWSAAGALCECRGRIWLPRHRPRSLKVSFDNQSLPVAVGSQNWPISSLQSLRPAIDAAARATI
jgi:hypothetical protein